LDNEEDAMLTDQDLQSLTEYKSRHGFSPDHVRQVFEEHGESVASGSVKMAVFLSRGFLRRDKPLDFWVVWDDLVDYESFFRPEDMPDSFRQIFEAFDRHELSTDPDTACIDDLRQAIDRVLGEQALRD
jgi:hypothetical protein